MTRGKYGAKAANRLAQLDNDIINGLRAELAAIKNERDVARLELEQFQRDAHAEAQRIAADMSRDALREVADQLVTEKAARDADRIRYCDEVWGLFYELGGQLPMEGYGRLAAIFGRGDALGELINRNVPRPGRSSRRARESRARLIAEFARQGGRLPS
jgi:hypothetical protein